MKVEIKWISEEKNDISLLIRCSKPHQKQTPLSNGKEERDMNEKLFQKYVEQHRRELNEYKKRAQQFHLGEAILTQDGK